jgi:CDP-paratose 2-epimerase
MEILITGGAGFIGSNLAARGLREEYRVVVFDNLSRPGTRWNLEWLQSLGPVEFVEGDVRDFSALRGLFERRRFDAVFHQAAQVAVTLSVEDPRTDFEVNALGTFNLLEAIRCSGQNPVVIFSSTNKVYGSLAQFEVEERNGRYAFKDLPKGVPETSPLDFHSPYGCSKGCADQYMADYRRIYGLRTIVFRQSCIYGPRQIGLEDQGWLAWFTICAVLGRPITIYGDGKQVRDVLYIDDLVDLYFRAVECEPSLETFVFNVGGGPMQAVSLREVIQMLERELGRPITLRFADWRPGDQRVYVSDISRVAHVCGWRPTVSVSDGIKRLVEWVWENRATLALLVEERA